MFGTITANANHTEEYLWTLTLPQIEMRYVDAIRYKFGPHGMIGDEDDKRVVAEKEHTIADALAFVEQFRGFGG